MKGIFNPRKLTRIGQTRGWAAVAFTGSKLELTSARSEDGQLKVLQQASASAAPPADAENAGPRWPAAAQSLRQQFDPHEHRVVTSVSCEDVLCQMLKLPATEPGELKQMLDLQIDNITPLPLEEVVYSFEPLETADGQTRVLVAITPKAAVNERVAALEEAGLPPEIVSVDALAMFYALYKRRSLPADDLLNILVILGTNSANVIVFSRGAPLAVRTIVLSSGDEGEAVLREELQRTLVAAEAEQPQRAIGMVTFLAQSDELKSLAERLAVGLNAPTSFLTNGVAPSAGMSLCLQCAVDGPSQLNLLPDEWRQKRRAAALRQRLIRGAIAVGAVYALALAIFLMTLGIKSAQQRSVQREILHLQPKFSEARQTQGILVSMRNQLDTKFSALEVLREITVRMPEGVRLNEFVFKKDQTVSLKGQAPTQAVAIDLQSRLEKSELFSKVAAGRIDSAGGLTKFDMVCTLKTAVAPGLPAAGGQAP